MCKYIIMPTQMTISGTGPLGTDSTTKAKTFYTAMRDFDYTMRAVLAASPRQILSQCKEVMRRFDAIIDASAAHDNDKGDYFQRLKLRTQNAKTRAVGPMLRAIENASQYGGTRPRLMSILGAVDLQTAGREAAEASARWTDAAHANHLVAAYRLDQLLNAGIVAPAFFATVRPDGTPLDLSGVIQHDAPTLNDSFDVLLSMDTSPLNQMARQLRRENQHKLIEVLLQGGDALASLPPYADAAFGFNILALDGELLTLVMDDLLDSQQLGVLSQQLIEVHAHLLHLELDGQMFSPSQWRMMAQQLF